jgi:hypothetical protein
MTRAKPDPNLDRHGSVRACAAVPAAQAALQGLSESLRGVFAEKSDARAGLRPADRRRGER